MTPFLYAFVALSAAHVAAEFFGFLPGRYATKPLLMPALAAHYIAAAASPSPLLVAAMAGGWLGDLFLMIPDPGRTRRFFLPGLLAFLAGHAFYVAAFAARAALPPPPLAWAAFAVYAAVGWTGYRLVGPASGKMRKAILAYSAILVALGVSAALPLAGAEPAGTAMAMAGALVFMASDIANAYNRFVKEIPRERVITMSTYLAGQALLVAGYLAL